MSLFCNDGVFKTLQLDGAGATKLFSGFDRAVPDGRVGVVLWEKDFGNGLTWHGTASVDGVGQFDIDLSVVGHTIKGS